MDTEATNQIESVLAHHMQSLGGGKLEDVLSDYSEESVLFTPNGVVKGLTGIREFFDAAIKSMPPDLMEHFTMIRQDIDCETAYILWKAEPYLPLSTDTFTVHKGKIMVQTYTPFAQA